MNNQNVRSLDVIGRELGCDKSSLAHDYLKIYETLFAPWREAPVTLLEFCAGDVSSLKVWARHFPNGRIVGVFGTPPAVTGLDNRIELQTAQQDDTRRLAELIETYDPDIVIDDGSHRWRHQIQSFRTILPLLKPHAVYVVEDLQTSFSDTGGYDDGRDRSHSAARYLATLVPGIASGYRDFDGADGVQTFAAGILESVTFAYQLCILRRNGRRLRRYRLSAAPDRQAWFEETGGNAYRRLPARIEGSTAWLRRQFDEVTGVDPVTAPSARLSEFRDATVYGRGVVATASGQMVADSLLNVYGNQSNIDGLHRVVGTDFVLTDQWPTALPADADMPHVLMKQRWDENYGHWLIESFCRLAIVRKHYDLRSCRFIVGNASAPMRAVYLDSLELAGVDRGAVRTAGDGAITVKRLIYPHPLTVQPWVKSPLCIRFLEEIRDKVIGSRPADGGRAAPRRVLVVRGRNSRRKLRNFDAVEAVARAAGFELVEPDAMTFAAQVTAFSRAEVVVGILGAELANIAFAPAGVTLFGLAPEAMQDDFFYDLICHKNGSYTSLHGPSVEGTPNMQSDFSIDVATFERVLGALLR